MYNVYTLYRHVLSIVFFLATRAPVDPFKISGPWPRIQLTEQSLAFQTCRGSGLVVAE